MSKKQLFTVEIPVKCSPNILFDFLSTSSGLQEWFADNVVSRGNEFTFSWFGMDDAKATLFEIEEFVFVKFKWHNSPPNEYFEFRITHTEISDQTVLLINDFAEKNDIKDQKTLWEYQAKELLHRLGS